MFSTYDRIRETTTDGGTTFATLSVYAPNYLRFSDLFAINQRFPYAMVSPDAFEIGIGYLNSSGQLVRDTVLSSSNFTNVGGNITFSSVNFTPGILKDVFLAQPASLTTTLPSAPTNTYTGSQLVTYENVGGGYEWQLTSIPSLNLPSVFTDGQIFFAKNAHFSASNNLTFDSLGTPNNLNLTGNLIINGNIQATAKEFCIPHPIYEDKKLIHGSLEGPEHGIYFRINFKIKKTVIIEFPDYFPFISTNYSLFLTTEDGSRLSYKIKDNHISIRRRILWGSETDAQLIIIGSRTDCNFNLIQ